MQDLMNTIQHSDIFDLCARLEDASVDMILCDLPYGTTACHWDTVIPFEPMWEAFKRVIKPRGAIVLTAIGMFAHKLACSNEEMYRYEWIIDKGNPTGHLNANRMPLTVHDNALVFSLASLHYNPQMIPYDKPRIVNG